MEVINLADIRFRDEPTITIIDEHGNELYVTQPMLVDETFGAANTFNTGAYLPISGGTLTGPLAVGAGGISLYPSGGSVTFANGTWNTIGDDTRFGDINVANTAGFQSTSNANIGYLRFGNTGTGATIGTDGTSFAVSKDTAITGALGTTGAITEAGTLLSNKYVNQAVQYTNPTWLAAVDATTIKTGTIDLARLPAMPSANTIVCTTIPAMSAGDQLLVAQGTVVIESTTGNTYRYSGTGSVVLAASYIQQSDLTPDWAVITNRPTLVSTWTNDAGYLTPASALDPAKISQNTSYRFVTDADKAAWTAKQNALGNASATVSGILTSTDWAIFNAKQPAGSYLTPTSQLTWNNVIDRPTTLSGYGIMPSDTIFDTRYLGKTATAVWANGADKIPMHMIAGVYFDGTADIDIPYANLTGKPTTFAPSAHVHAATDVTQTASYRFVTDTEKATWNAKISANQTITLSGIITGSGTTAITTAMADGALSIAKTSGLQTALDGKIALTSPITGYVVGTNAALAATDTVLGAFNKIQAQLNAKQASGSYLTGNQTITVSGDATGSGTTAIALTLASTGVTAGTYASVGNYIPTITVDAKGRVTGIANMANTPAWSAITGKPTTLSGYGITDAAASGHTHTIANITDNAALVQGNNANTGAQGKRTTALSNVVGAFQSNLPSGFYDGNATDTPNANWCHLINSTHNNSYSGNQYQFQIAASFDNSISTLLNSGNGNWGRENYFVRTLNTSGAGAWRTLWHSGNFTPGNYQPVENQRLSTSNAPTFAGITINGSVVSQGLNAQAGSIFTSSSVTGNSFIKSGGTAAQFLKADGSVDNNTYATTAALGSYQPKEDQRLSTTNAPTFAALTVAGEYIDFTAISSWEMATVQSHAHSNIANLNTITQSLATTAVPTFGGLYTTGTIKGVQRPDVDFGTTVYATSTGSRSALSNGTNSVKINRWQYSGFTGYIGSNTAFFGMTQDHQNDIGGQLSIIAGGTGTSHIGFFAGTPTLLASGSGSGCYQAPLVGTWNSTGLTVNGTLTVATSITTGNGSTFNGDITVTSCSYIKYARINATWSGSGSETFVCSGNGRFTDYLAVNGRMYSNDCQINGVAFGSGDINNWNSCYDYAVSKGRIGMDAYTGEDTLTWASRNSRGNHFGRIHNTSGCPNYFNFLQIKETSGTVFGAIGHAADGNWYVGRATSGQEISTYYIVWTTKDISIAARDSWNTSTARVDKIANYANAYGIDRLYRRDATTVSNKYYIYNAWATGQWCGNAWRISSANEHSDGESGITTTLVNYADLSNRTYYLKASGGTNVGANVDTGFAPNESGLWAGSIDAPTGTAPFGSAWTWMQEWGHADSNWRTQLASAYFSDNMAYRRKNNGTWMSWRYLLSTNAAGEFDNINLKIPGNKTFTIDGDMISNKTISYTVAGSDLTGAGPYNIGPLDRNVLACPVATSIVMQTHTYAYFKIINAIGGTVAVTAAGGATMKRGSGGTATQVNVGAGQTMIIGYTPGFGFYFGYLY
jgi:hypothetical protein